MKYFRYVLVFVAAVGVLLVLGAVARRVLAQGAVEKRFDQLDANKDGKLTPDELREPEFFKRLDLNGDGEVTKAEAARAFARGALNELLKPTPKGDATNRAAQQIEAIAKAADKNGDGKITREEADGAPWFERVDQNGDGVIDAREVEAVKAIAARGGTGGKTLPATPAVTPEDVKKITNGPEILKPGDVGIGRMVADVSFTDLAGKTHRLSEWKSDKGVVIAMTSASCPVSKRFLPSLAALEKELRGKDIALLLVNPFASETKEKIQAQLASHAFAVPYVHDKDRSLATALRARTTTEVFLLDARRTLVYRGALDDQYGINYNLEAPRHRFLLDAVAALLNHETPLIAATAAPGCELDLDDASGAAAPVTYYRDVARILQQYCVTCHREGGIAPFALDNPESVRERARVIKRVVTERTMPPWFAARPGEGEASPWANDCSLSTRDRADLLAWLESGDRPLGDAADAPVKRVYPSEWSIGKPDLVVPLSRAYDIKATGFMPYAFDVVQTDVTEDKWVTAYEILPSERDVVHHVIVKVHEKGSTVRNGDEGAGGYWAVYVPGNGAHRYPDGFARRLPAGSHVSFQIHYTPSGEAKKERLRLGLVFAKTPPQYEVRTVGIANPRIAIPAGATAHVETQTQPVPFDIPITSFMAHMHIRGKAFKYEIAYPDGKNEVLLDIPRYDFNWQLRYDLKAPKVLPAGSTVKITAVYDNSAGNKANPDPTRRVKWGAQTVDEMMIGYLDYFVPVAGGKTPGR